MRQYTLIAVGKCKEAFWREACAEYEKRLGGFARLRIVEVEEARLADAPSEAQTAAAVREEGRRILEKIPPDSRLIALCIEGTPMSSQKLSQTLDRWAVEGAGRVTLVIGGSYGLSDEVKQKAKLRLSMSPMTFPHQLARVMLLEQLYRAAQISVGGKYHK